MNLACVLCKMTLPEALVAATINAGIEAQAIRLQLRDLINGDIP